MHRLATGVIGATFGLGILVGAAASARSEAQSSSMECGTSSALQLRTTLYFGLARPKGSVSELEWQIFLRDEVTARFPDGLTVWEAEGQWRRSDGVVDHERSKVLLLVHPDTPAARASLQNVIARYRERFEQQSVLWETARVCATP